MTSTRVPSAVRPEISGPAPHICELIELVFPAGTVRSTNADRDVTPIINGVAVTFPANAILIDFPSDLAEETSINSRSVTFNLNGLDQTLLTRLMTDNYTAAPVQFYQAVFDEKWQPLGIVALCDQLIMSTGAISLDAGTGTVELTVESWTVFGKQDSAVLGSPENQRQRYAGDTGFDRVAAIMTQEVEWKRAGKATFAIGGGGSGPTSPGMATGDDRARNF